MPRSSVPSYLSAMAALAMIGLAGCSPRVSLLYVDYEVEGDPATTADRVAEGFQEAGWELAPPEVPNAVRTTSRTFDRRILYKTIAYLEAVPIGDEYVRVFIHPFRHPFVGARNKLPYMPNTLRRAVFRPLGEALETREIFQRGAARPELDGF
ncbi:MAG: hypothetical protein SH809_02750 [Rhodothermales bacterium]|nr:hypothetical protein [Rhodothermales bacterium]